MKTTTTLRFARCARRGHPSVRPSYGRGRHSGRSLSRATGELGDEPVARLVLHETRNTLSENDIGPVAQLAEQGPFKPLIRSPQHVRFLATRSAATSVTWRLLANFMAKLLANLGHILLRAGSTCRGLP